MTGDNRDFPSQHIMPAEMGLTRWAHTGGYVQPFGDDNKVPCTCNEGCVNRYCSGKECGCAACKLFTSVTFDETLSVGADGFSITYARAVQKFGKNIADDYAGEWVDQRKDVLPSRALR